MARKTIRQILDQRLRALTSLSERRNYREGGDIVNKSAYIQSQKDAYRRDGKSGQDPTLYALDRANLRRTQISRAAENAINRLREQRKAYKVGRAARGLTAG